jgi:hypothetical protein
MHQVDEAPVGPWRTIVRPGDEPVGQRQFVTLDPITLEIGRTPWGDQLPITMCFETWGKLDPDASNAVLVLHGFTADSHAAGPAIPRLVGGMPSLGLGSGSTPIAGSLSAPMSSAAVRAPPARRL